MTIDAGNLAGGIKSFAFYMMYYAALAFQIQFTPNIAKDNTKTLSLTFTVTWARRP